MKFRLFIDRNREEEVIVYAHERNEVVDSIERLVSEGTELMGYSGKTAVRLYLNEVYCFIVENNRVYAVTETEKYEMKLRLYQLEKIADKTFVKINQSCIANIGKIERFDASVSGTMRVIFKNGYTDYVSRRQVKNVKERLGLLL